MCRVTQWMPSDSSCFELPSVSSCAELSTVYQVSVFGHDFGSRLAGFISFMIFMLRSFLGMSRDHCWVGLPLME